MDHWQQKKKNTKQPSPQPFSHPHSHTHNSITSGRTLSLFFVPQHQNEVRCYGYRLRRWRQRLRGTEVRKGAKWSRVCACPFLFFLCPRPVVFAADSLPLDLTSTLQLLWLLVNSVGPSRSMTLTFLTISKSCQPAFFCDAKSSESVHQQALRACALAHVAFAHTAPLSHGKLSVEPRTGVVTDHHLTTVPAPVYNSAVCSVRARLTAMRCPERVENEPRPNKKYKFPEAGYQKRPGFYMHSRTAM